MKTNAPPQAREEVEAKTVAGILTLVERERTGVDVNRPLLRSLLRMLSALGVRDRSSTSFSNEYEVQYLSKGRNSEELFFLCAYVCVEVSEAMVSVCV